MLIKFTIRTVAKILTYLLAAVTFVAAYGGHIDPHLWATPQLLVLAYPYLALLTVTAGVIWLCSRRYIVAGVCLLALIGGGGALTDNLAIGTDKKARPGQKCLTVMTFNVVHGWDVRRRASVQNITFSYILRSGADIVCMQECYNEDEIPEFTPALRDSLHQVYPYRILDPATDLAVYSKIPISRIASGTGSSWMKIYELYTIRYANRDIAILNLHLAPYMLSEKERQVVTDVHGVRSARNSLAEFKGSILTKMKNSYRNRALDADKIRAVIDSVKEPLIVCGDFNDVPSSWAYRTIRGTDLRDAYKETGLGMMVTYNLHGFLFHIDQMLYRGEGIQALFTRKGDTDASDHYPQAATFAITPRN